MARRKKQADASQFSKGAKVEGLETVEKLANSAAAAKPKGIGHNSGGITDDELKRQIQKIAEAKADVDKQQAVLDKAKGVLRNAYKVAKDRGAPTDEIRDYFAMKRLSEGEVVTSHRNMGRILRVMNDPLGTQYNLFAEPAAEGEEPGKPTVGAMDAELQGQAAYRNNEPTSNNPFQPGTDNYVAWDTGWHNAMKHTVMAMGPNSPTEASDAAETH